MTHTWAPHLRVPRTKRFRKRFRESAIPVMTLRRDCRALIIEPNAPHAVPPLSACRR